MATRELFNVWVEGLPKAQPRPRAASRGGRAVVYDAGTADGWKRAVEMAVRPYGAGNPVSGALALSVHIYLPRPARLCRRSVPARSLPHTSRPDADNLLKAVMDAITTAGIWQDDAQVAVVMAGKHYAAIDGRTGAQITLAALDWECEAVEGGAA
jgi:Holliday junction resolvase RusA-like endonuclease